MSEITANEFLSEWKNQFVEVNKNEFISKNFFISFSSLYDATGGEDFADECSRIISEFKGQSFPFENLIRLFQGQTAPRRMKKI